MRFIILLSVCSNLLWIDPPGIFLRKMEQFTVILLRFAIKGRLSQLHFCTI